jgi:membrane DNA delivery protein
MDDRLWTGVVSIALGILGIATLAVIVSPKANTANVINAGGAAFANDIGAAIAPVSGASYQINTGSSFGIGSSSMVGG